MSDTLSLLKQAYQTGEDILGSVKKIKHNKGICTKLHSKVTTSQQTINQLITLYMDNCEYFEMESYNLAFKNYLEVLTSCLKFLIYIDGKGLFIRLIQADKYKKTFYHLFLDIDQAVSMLKLGLNVKTQLTSFNSETMKNNDEEMLKIVSRLGGLKEDAELIENERQNIATEIKNASSITNCDILNSAEISVRLLKPMAMDIARKGRRYHVHKRTYNGEIVAEKIFLEKLEPGLINKILKEVLILKKLSICPYIIRFLGVSFRAKQIGLVVQYAEKGNLKDLLESSLHIDQNTLFTFSLDIIQGLAFLHELEVLHKNIKTSSILILDNMQAKISGFEFSRELSSNTTVITDVGSDRFRWLAPEKIGNSLAASFTQKSDVYSLGMVLWSIWTRKYPFEIMSQKSIEELVLQGDREDLSLVEILEIKNIVAQCWNQDPDKRPMVYELISELDLILDVISDDDVLENDYRYQNTKTDDPIFNLNIGSLEQLSINPKETFINSPIFPTPDFAPISPYPHVTTPKPSAPLEEYINNNKRDEEDDMKYDTHLFHHDMEDLDDKSLFDEIEIISFETAMDYHIRGNRSKAMEQFRHLVVHENHSKAAYYLGYYYFWGQDKVVQKNWDLSLKYLTMAADQNDSDALDHLGVYYASDDNPKKNMNSAFLFYKRAAELDNKKALYHLGVCYAKGRGVKASKELALKYIADAAARGHTLAIEQLNRLKLKQG